MKKKRGRLTLVVLLGIAVLLLIFGAAADVIGTIQFTDTLTAQYQDTARSIAKEAASLIDPDDLEGYLTSGGTSPEYLAAHEGFQRLCDNMDTEFIYVVRAVDDRFETLEYLIETVNRNSAFSEFPVGYRMDVSTGEYTPYQDCCRRLYTEDLDEAFVVQNHGSIETGYHITAMLSLRDGNGAVKGVLGVQKQMDYLARARGRYIRSIVITSVVLIVLSSAGWFGFLRRRLLRPITAISREAERFAAENTLAEHPLSDSIQYQDELGALAFVIDNMEERTFDYFTSLGKITEEKQRVDAELNLATAIQANMLPNTFPPFPERKEFDLYAAMDPAREVGGDLYDFFMTDEHHLALVIADVSGKGVPAALYMVIAKILIKNHAQMGMSPAEVFTRVNEILCESNRIEMFVTAWMAFIDLRDGQMTVVNAGHNPPLVKSGADGYEYLKLRAGFVLAGMEGMKYRQTELTLKPGDRLFLYTDGVTEATDASEQLYGEKRLKDYLNAHAGDGVRETLDGLRADVDAFVGDAEQFDDMTMLLFDYHPSDPADAGV